MFAGSYGRLMNMWRTEDVARDLRSEKKQKETIAAARNQARMRYGRRGRRGESFLPVAILQLEWRRARWSSRGTHNARWFTSGVNHSVLRRGSAGIYRNGPSRISGFDFRPCASLLACRGFEEVFFLFFSSSSTRRSISSKSSIVPPSRDAAMLEWDSGFAAGTRGVESGWGSEHREEKTDWNENFEYLQLELGISRATRSNLLENIDEILRRAGFRTFSRKNGSGCMRLEKSRPGASEVNAKVSLNIRKRARHVWII